jgi:YfiR/HmsC-like
MTIFARKYRAIFLLLVWVLLFPLRPELEAATGVESKVKAAFVVNFARFISWPEGSFEVESDPLVICTIGLGEDEAAFAGIETKKIKGHPIALKKISSLGESMHSCHLLYVKGVSHEHLEAYLCKSEALPVVTIGESDGFAGLGGTIEFVKVHDRLSFKINNKKAKERQLRINASLLNLAVEVY